jgi:hypothetical protein
MDIPSAMQSRSSKPSKPRVSSAITPAARTSWHAVKCVSLDDMRTQNIRYWQQQGGAAIREAAWQLVVETWHAQGRDPDELRFHRPPPAVRKA